MSDLIVRTAVRTKVEARCLPQTLAGLARRARERLQSEETGAEVIEYGGILVLVGLIIVALIQLNIPSLVTTHVGHAIQSILNQSGGGGGNTGSTAGGANP